MLKSKFSFWTYLVYVITICNLLLIANLFISRKDVFGEYYNLKFLFVFSILFGITFLFVFIIIKPRALIILIDNSSIQSVNIFQRKKIKFDEFKGFFIKTEITRVGLKFEILTLISKDNSEIIVAESMYRNYLELKKNIVQHLKEIDNS